MADPGVFALPLVRLWPFLGLWTMHVWIYWFNTTRLWTALPDVPWWVSIYGVMTIVMVCAAMVHWGVPTDGISVAGRRRCTFDLALTALMCATTLSVQACVLVGPSELVAAGWSCANLVFGGICMAWGYLRWSAVYARLGIRDAVGCLFASYLIGSTLKVLFDVTPLMVGTCLAFCLPIISQVSVHTALDAAWPRPEERSGEVLYHRGTLSMLLRLALCVFVFCFVREMVSVTSHWGAHVMVSRTLSHAVEVSFALIALWYVFLRNRPLDFPQLWRFVFFFLATTLLVDCVSGALGIDLGVGSRLFEGVATSLVVMLLWLLLSDIAHHSDLHPYVIFGVGWSLYVGSNYLGMVLAHFMGLEQMSAILGLVLVYALGMAMVFCLETRDADVQRIFADMRKKVAPEEFATIDERCEVLAREFDLTAREVEVMKLLAKGRSKGFIAEELYVSENTVRGHARRLYAKLDVHTKAELQDLLGL